jgi:hypothetical protein
LPWTLLNTYCRVIQTIINTVNKGRVEFVWHLIQKSLICYIPRNILGRGLGERKLKVILDKYPFICTNKKGALKLTVEDIKEVKAFVYELLMRNYRWIEAVHCMLDVIISHPSLTDSQRLKCLDVLAKCEATATGYTIPSYRIPIIWESLFVQIRNVLFKAT